MANKVSKVYSTRELAQEPTKTILKNPEAPPYKQKAFYRGTKGDVKYQVDLIEKDEESK